MKINNFNKLNTLLWNKKFLFKFSFKNFYFAHPGERHGAGDVRIYV